LHIHQTLEKKKVWLFLQQLLHSSCCGVSDEMFISVGNIISATEKAA